MKNLKVSPEVHEELENRKEKGDTFDDVLKGILDLKPSLDDLVAYFPEELQEKARMIVEEIEETGEMKREVEERHGNHVLVFESEVTGRKIVECTFSEDKMDLAYRNQVGDMKNFGWIDMKEGEPRAYNNFEKNISEYSDEVKEKVKGAWRKWGE